VQGERDLFGGFVSLPRGIEELAVGRRLRQLARGLSQFKIAAEKIQSKPTTHRTSRNQPGNSAA
jgi:hypothetical protein